MLKIAIVIGSTRPGRNSEGVARWVLEYASQRHDAVFELVDLREFELPLLDEPTPPAMGPAVHAHTERWAAAIAPFDAYVFVTPEYNHAPPAALKNAIDFLYREWHDKAVGFVSFGVEHGSCAVEQLRLVAGELRMADVQTHVGLSFADDFEHFTTCKPRPQRTETLRRMLDQLVAWALALRAVRISQVTSNDEPKRGLRPALNRDVAATREAHEAVARLVAELQAGGGARDAELFNHSFAADVMWGSPYGQIVRGYDQLHAIHARLLGQARGRGSSQYQIDSVLSPTPDLAIAHVRRVALDATGQAIAAESDAGGTFSEMALYVLVRRAGVWWLAAGQNTLLRPPPVTPMA